MTNRLESHVNIWSEMRIRGARISTRRDIRDLLVLYPFIKELI